MTTANDVLGSVVALLNSQVTDPLSTRVGSYFFRPEQDLSYSKYMPKGKVDFGNTTYEVKKRSFGTPFSRDKVISLEISFYTNKGDTFDGKKNEVLIDHFIGSKIDYVLTHNMINNAHLIGFGTVDLKDNYLEQFNTYYGILPVIYELVE